MTRHRKTPALPARVAMLACGRYQRSLTMGREMELDGRITLEADCHRLLACGSGTGEGVLFLVNGGPVAASNATC